MNILFYTTSFFPKKDGVTFRLKQWIDHWDKQDNLFIMTPASKVVSFYQGVRKIIKVPGANFYSSFYPDVSHTDYFRLFEVVSLLKKVIRQYAIDVLHIIGPECMIGSFFTRLGVPTYLSYHTNVVSYFDSHFRNKDVQASYFLMYYFWWFMEKLALHRPLLMGGNYSRIFLPSTYLKSQLVDQSLLDQENLNRVSILSPIIDLETFHYDPNVKKDLKTLLFVGRLAVEKNLTLLFDVLKYLKGYTLWIVGGGIMKEKLEALAEEEKNNKIVFLGEKEQSEIVPYYQQAGFFINPSSTETMGFTTIEAMACRTAVIVYPEGGTLSLVEDGVTGAFFKTGEEGARQIENIRKDFDFYQKITLQAYRQVQDYTVQSNVKMLRSSYQNSL